jgi:hypothetical protein
MTAFICSACGTTFPPTGDGPPERCPICEEERQFVPPDGQRWTTQEELARTHSNSFRQHEPALIAITTVPHFAIGQRAFLILSEHGNVLWDCLTLLDGATITLIKALGGISAIAISHPHYYTAMSRWSRSFAAPVFLHEDDRRHVVDCGGDLVFWQGETRELRPGMTLVRCGGHFAGGTVLHWADGSFGAGALLSGDVLQVVPDRRHVGFMRSYPNLVPLSAKVVERIAARLAPYRFKAIYGAFAEREILEDGEEALRRSAERYVRAVSGAGPADAEP